MDAIVWLGIVIVLIVIEIATLGLTTIWFAGGALAACIAALLQADLMVQVLLFFAVSVLLLLFTRPAAARYLNKNRTKTNVESLIGMQGIVLEEVDNLKEQGLIRLNGMEWTARTEKDGEILARDTAVEVVRIDGVKAIVRKKEGNDVCNG